MGEGGAYLSTTVNEAVIGENAALTWYKFQCEADKAYHFGGTYANQADNARFSHHNFAFGGLLARSDIHCNLDKAAECELNGLYLGSNRQHLDNHTRINHLQPHGISPRAIQRCTGRPGAGRISGSGGCRRRRAKDRFPYE